MLSFSQSRKKNVPIFIVFCFVSSCKEANTLCFVFQVSIKKPIYCHSHKTKIQKPNQQKLQKPSKSSTSKEHLEALTRRLSLWNEGKINELLYEGQTIQDRLKAPENAPKTSQISKKFKVLMWKGNGNSTLKLFTNSMSNGILPLSNKTLDLLKQKHPLSLRNFHQKLFYRVHLDQFTQS